MSKFVEGNMKHGDRSKIGVDKKQGGNIPAMGKIIFLHILGKVGGKGGKVRGGGLGNVAFVIGE